MRRRPIPTAKLQLPSGRATITFGGSWLVAIPAGVWVIGAIYVSILGAFLNPAETWMVTIVIALLSGLSLIGHVGAHAWAAQAAGSDIPNPIPLYPLGDAAQLWPAATTPWREALVALAGPLTNLILAGLAYLVWNLQLNPYLNLATLFLVIFNIGLAAINLTPVFPLDGGRLARAILWGLLAKPAWGTRLATRLGFWTALLLMGWGIFLIAQQARFSWPNGTATVAVAGLMLLPLMGQPLWQWDRPVPSRPSIGSTILVRAPIAGLLILSMLGITISLVPTNNGLEAPGIAAPVEPMVEVPAEHRYLSTGSFLLTTVFSQTPISAGQWLFGQLSPVVKLVPPEQIVPPDTTAQELARQQYQMLDNSQMTAIAVGLQLAGYDVGIKGQGARILSVLPDSPAKSMLQPGDVIIGFDGEAIGDVSELTGRLKTQTPQATVELQIERDGRLLPVVAPLMPQSDPKQPPRIGITVENVGFVVELPFPVKIVPQKIVGGPSAGLMFTLTVYDMVTPADLTGGRVIAGTGTINLDGTVGPIGGVQQKVAGAEYAGAEYFLSPPENYDDARSVARQIKVVKVATAEEAIQFLRSLPPQERQP
jgi:PDZ domain-containing protein